jgi:hypothetical protein
MNHIVVSDKDYRLFGPAAYAECAAFAKDWAIKNKRSPKIVSERSFVETKARQAGADAQQLVLTAVAEHQVDGAVITKAINTLVESGEYGWSNVLKPYPMPRPDYIETSQSHGIREYGDGALRAYQYCDSNSMADGVFRHRHDRHGWVWIILCKDTDGCWYARVVRMVKGVVTEITAFMVQDGTENWQVVSK